MEDDGEDGTWQLVVHLHTDTRHSHTRGPRAARLPGRSDRVLTCSQCTWALRLRWCADCLNSTWMPDRKFLLTGQECGWRIIMVAPLRFTCSP